MSLPLFEPVKAVQDTSIQAYREIAPTLSRREQQVLGMLGTFAHPPTAYELAHSLIRIGMIQDVNGCRPRLTALLAKRLIRKGDKRVCTITGKTAYTWVIA